MADLATAKGSGCGPALEGLIRLTRPHHAQELSSLLLAHFGTLGELLAARTADRASTLAGLPDVEHMLQSVRNAIEHVLRSKLVRGPILSSDQAVLDYLRCCMAFEPIEHFRVLFLNSANELIADEVMALGTVSAVHPYPREIVKRCLEFGATALLLAHNHPSGHPVPSKADIEFTHRLVGAALSLGIAVHDHLVVAKNGYTSFRKEGLL